MQRFQLGPLIEEHLKNFLRGLPVVSQSLIFEYAVMLYFCITGQLILLSDLHYKDI